MIYNIITTDTVFELKELINEMMQHGWRPQGGIAVTTRHNYTVDIGDRYYIKNHTSYSQAMIKEKE